MPNSSFDLAFKDVVGEEGGYVNDPRDPGGETKFGISKRAFPNLDIKNLTIDQAKEIYRKNYWDKICGDDLPFELALPVFDAAVNEGVREASCEFQRVLGLAPDGMIGQSAIDAARNANADEILARFMAEELNFKDHLKIWACFGLGWLRRAFRIAVAAVRGN